MPDPNARRDKSLRDLADEMKRLRVTMERFVLAIHRSTPMTHPLNTEPTNEPVRKIRIRINSETYLRLIEGGYTNVVELDDDQFFLELVLPNPNKES